MAGTTRRNRFLQPMEKSMVRVAGTVLVVLLYGAPARAEVIDFTTPGFIQLAEFSSSGLVEWDDQWTWNGQPRSATNSPSDAQLRLRATVNLYVDDALRNLLFVQLTDVVTTQGANWFESAFDAVTQTGIRMTSPFFATRFPGFSSSFANAGQVLACCSPPEQVTPLSATPGYELDSAGSALLIHTSNGTSLGWTSLRGIYNAERIRGGGVFSLAFGDDVDLLDASLWESLVIDIEYGAGRQYIGAKRVQPVPEAGTFALVATGVTVFGFFRRKRVRTEGRGD